LAWIHAASILWELATPEIGDVQSEAVIGQTIGLIVGLFVVPGVLPLIYWAVRRFRAESAYEMLGAWSGLAIALLLLQRIDHHPFARNIVWPPELPPGARNLRLKQVRLHSPSRLLFRNRCHR
jgi:hypothetical protein